MRVFRRSIPAIPWTILLAAACGGGVSSSDLSGVWISTDTTSRVEFFADGRATMSDPLNSIGATWVKSGGTATLAISDTTGAPADIAIEKSGEFLTLRIETDSVVYARANPTLEAAFARIGNNEAITAMTENLAMLKDAQNTILQLTKGYASSLPLDFQPTNSVTVAITGATATSWSAVASHPASKTKCSIAVGGGANGLVDCR